MDLTKMSEPELRQWAGDYERDPLGRQVLRADELSRRLAAAEAKVKAESDAAYMLSIMVKERDAQLAAAEARERVLREGLDSAARSLETLSVQAGKECLEGLLEIRGFSNNRAIAARQALAAAPEPGTTKGDTNEA